MITKIKNILNIKKYKTRITELEFENSRLNEYWQHAEMTKNDWKKELQALVNDNSNTKDAKECANIVRERLKYVPDNIPQFTHGDTVCNCPLKMKFCSCKTN